MWVGTAPVSGNTLLSKSPESPAEPPHAGNFMKLQVP